MYKFLLLSFYSLNLLSLHTSKCSNFYFIKNMVNIFVSDFQAYARLKLKRSVDLNHFRTILPCTLYFYAVLNHTKMRLPLRKKFTCETKYTCENM